METLAAGIIFTVMTARKSGSAQAQAQMVWKTVHFAQKCQPAYYSTRQNHPILSSTELLL